MINDQSETVSIRVKLVRGPNRPVGMHWLRKDLADS